MKNGRENEAREKDRRSAERRTHPQSSAAPRKPARVVEPVNRDISVTVSIGAAEPNTRLRTVEEVIQAADKALYRAKQSGRNRVELSSAPRKARLKRSIA
jgi:diguanylate cyclase (GGDEF)-like protein